MCRENLVLIVLKLYNDKDDCYCFIQIKLPSTLLMKAYRPKSTAEIDLKV